MRDSTPSHSGPFYNSTSPEDPNSGDEHVSKPANIGVTPLDKQVESAGKGNRTAQDFQNEMRDGNKRETKPELSSLLTGKDILVTGGAGFIGSHLVETLIAENTVTVLDNLSSGTITNVPDSAEFVQGDMRTLSSLTDLVASADIVFHQAGFVSVEESLEKPLRSHKHNVTATARLLDSARKGDTRVITASSAAIYGQPSQLPVTEEEPPAPESPYGVDKLTIDRYTRLFNELYDLPTVTLRYFNVYGPRQSAASYSGVISTFLQQAVKGTDLTIHGDGRQTRDFVHVTDVVRANILAATTDQTGMAYNVGTGTETAIEELATVVQSATSTSAGITHLPERPGDITHSCADISRATEYLGYTPSISLESGLRALIDYSAASSITT